MAKREKEPQFLDDLLDAEAEENAGFEEEIGSGEAEIDALRAERNEYKDRWMRRRTISVPLLALCSRVLSSRCASF